MQNVEEQEIVFKERKRLLFFGLPWTFTKYFVTDDLITMQKGFFRVEENDCYMYKVQDVKLTTTLLQRMFKLGTVTLYTGDVTNPQLVIMNVKRSKEIKNYLLKASEEARVKRRTLNTLNISADEMEEYMDGQE